MNKNSRAMTSKWVYRYKRMNYLGWNLRSLMPSIKDCYRLTAISLCLLLSIQASAQEYKRTFSKELNTANQLTISTNVPSSLSIQIDGDNAHRSNTKFGYIIKGNNNKDRLYINKDFVIETWDKNIVRQEVDIVIKSDNEETAQTILDRLKIDFQSTIEGHISIDANMNLMQFAIESKRFRKDICSVALNDGSKYNIDYLEIKTRLFIPIQANLKVSSILHHTLHLGNLKGDLDLDLQYGEVYGKKINNLNANLSFCFNVIFEEANNVVASATNSYLKIPKVNRLQLGKIRLKKGPLVNGDQVQWLDNNSSMNLYNFRKVERMTIHDTANDDFTIGEIDDLEVISSIYSNYNILKLNNQLSFKGKNGDLSIAEVNRDFRSIDIQNKLSKLNLNIADDGNYFINLFEPERLESKLPTTARELDKEGASSLQYKMGTGKSTAEINIRCERCELDVWD